ncbi:MAG: Na+ dependent nucleoside transporter [Saprospiraceae bacterium]|nr:Na+ dependent nucleoside transporter [Saprospiraceae bacterium]
MEWLMDFSRGILGLAVLLGIAFLLSRDRRAINWRLVGVGVLLQVLVAVAILKVPIINTMFDYVAKFFQAVLTFSSAGAKFLFGNIISDLNTFGYIFAFQVLPTIVFFSALSAILYYFGILQKIIFGMAWVMKRTMHLSGSESLAAAANVFIGQTEAPLVIKPYLEGMSRSELLCLMTGGMATIAGGVFAAYIGFLGGDDPVMQQYFAKHLLTASIMSAPAAVVAAKMLFPEAKEKALEEQMKMSGDVGDNLLDAISRGTTDGLKLAINVGAMLLVFTALIYMANEMLSGSIGEWTGWNERIRIATNGRFEGFTFTYLLGLLFAPVAWILGTPNQDMLVIGQLLGQKTVLNEFFAYAELKSLRDAGIVLHPKSLIIATYALCGFSNFASIGIQIGGIGVLAPGQRKALTELGLLALVGGTIACFMTACVAGFLVL